MCTLQRNCVRKIFARIEAASTPKMRTNNFPSLSSKVWWEIPRKMMNAVTKISAWLITSPTVRGKYGQCCSAIASTALNTSQHTASTTKARSPVRSASSARSPAGRGGSAAITSSQNACASSPMTSSAERHSRSPAASIAITSRRTSSCSYSLMFAERI